MEESSIHLVVIHISLNSLSHGFRGNVVLTDVFRIHVGYFAGDRRAHGNVVDPIIVLG